MAKITINIPDTKLQRILNGLAYQYGYQDEIEQPGPGRRDTKVPNPETKQQFVRRMLKRLIIQAVQQYESNEAAEQARQAKVSEVGDLLADLDIS
jgi:hypothetical protein